MTPAPAALATPPGRRRMTPRSPHEPHRVATSLELFFDLVFVVAVAQASASLHHAVAEHHIASALAGYLMAFFGVWWAWMNFTWFASAYDTDDVPYRLLVLVQMTGALIFAAGVPAVFEAHGPAPAGIAGYVVMRLAGVAQWLRAASSDPGHRRTALRYAGGITVVQAAWVALLFVPAIATPGSLVLAGLELAVPVWAEGLGMTPWHPHHIAERFQLFTLIVLGESILAATVAVQSGLASGDTLASLAPTIAGGLLIVFSMWWVYFDRPMHDLLTDLPRVTLWGYGHYFVFAAAAATGAGLAVTVDAVTHRAHLSPSGAAWAVAIPVAVYILALWVVHRRPGHRGTRLLGPLAAALILLAPLLDLGVLPIGLIFVALLVLEGGTANRRID